MRPGKREAGAAVAAILMAGALLALTGCEDSDPVAPEGSTISVSANPQNIVVPPGGGVGTSTIIATLRSKNGTRMPDQEVVFSTNQGLLDPPAQTILLTDDQGQATSELTTANPATVTAQSGSISGSTTIQIITGNLSNIALDATPQVLSDCSDQVDLLITALDPNGNGVGGVLISISKKSVTNFVELVGNLSPQQVTTDSFGEASATFTPDQNSCNQKCSSTAQGGGNCAVELTATAVAQSIASTPVQITEAVP